MSPFPDAVAAAAAGRQVPGTPIPIHAIASIVSRLTRKRTGPHAADPGACTAEEPRHRAVNERFEHVERRVSELDTRTATAHRELQDTIRALTAHRGRLFERDLVDLERHVF